MRFRGGPRARVDLGALSATAPAPICISGRAPGVLAFHGFGGTTREIELAATVAGEVGLSALARTLPGHGSHAKDLARTRFVDWVAGAESAYQELAARGPVIAAGLSMGSLLAAELAIQHPDRVRGLVLLANAAWLRPPLEFALRAGALLRLPDFLMKKGGSDISDPEARQSQVAYNADPVHAAIDLERSARELRERLKLVRCPTLILHGARDRVCPVDNAWRVARLLGTRDVRVVILPRSQHIITRDVERRDVARELREFYTRIADQTPVEP
ncbi:MAG TPA: alpha/beta fold hydrolase [Polyangiaceae bacterium]|nr:alpha/beta fold hydrolase [Polyangiaceae bacterium]